MIRRLLPIAALAFAVPASAEVVSSTDTGFTTRHQFEVAAPPAKVWSAFLQPGAWWEDSHTYSGDSDNITIDARAGGCWCETTPGGGSIEHMRTVYAQPGATLRFVGGLGPLQALPVHAVLTVALRAAGEGTEVTITYAVAGAGGGLAQLAAPVDQVLGIQWPRLKAAAERR